MALNIAHHHEVMDSILQEEEAESRLANFRQEDIKISIALPWGLQLTEEEWKIYREEKKLVMKDTIEIIYDRVLDIVAGVK